MKKFNRAATRRSVQGLSLIEIMISLVIGLVVVGAVLVSYIGSGQTNKRQAAYSEMNENAQIALSIMKNDLLLAGYSQPRGTVTVGMVTTFSKTFAGRAVFGCDVGFDNYSSAADAICKAGTAETPALEISYEADLTNTVPTSAVLPALPKPSDCLGNGLVLAPLAGTVEFFVTRNRYYVKQGPAGRGELYCGALSGSQPLIDNVDAMQIMYGESDGGALDPRQIKRYVTAANVTTWLNVVSVRVCLLMRSSEPVLSGEDVTAGSNNYLDCNSTSQASADRHVRRAYFLTTSLRNKMTF